MRKDILIYISIFLFCLTVMAVFLIKSYVRTDSYQPIYVDTLSVSVPQNIDPEPVRPNTVQTPQRRSFLDTDDQSQRSFIDRQSPSNVYEDETEQQFTSLVEQLRALFAGETEPPEEEEIEEIYVMSREEELQIIINSMTTQLDSLKLAINTFSRENEKLQREIRNRDDEINVLAYLIASLRDNIARMENEIIRLNTIEEPEIIPEIDYRQLGRVLNNMEINRVAQILQSLPPETAINVLKTMNARRMGQVMSALPPRVANQYSEMLLQ